MSTPNVFNYFMERMPEHDALFFEYTVDVPLAVNIARLEKELAPFKVDAIVGHSLGGVMASLMVARGKIKKGAAIASPLGGFTISNWLPINQMLIDTRSWAPIYRELRNHKFNEDFLSVVARGFDSGESDGLVPVYSQTALTGCKRIDVDTNHFEVMLLSDVAEAIRDHIF